jgi:hypothetical protein
MMRVELADGVGGLPETVPIAVAGWACFAGVILGIAVSWYGNATIVKAVYAVERARHHYRAAADWVHRLFGDAARLALVVVVMVCGLGGAAWGLWWLTVHTMARS